MKQVIIKLKILNKYRVDFFDIIYYPKITKNYTLDVYSLVLCLKTPILDIVTNNSVNYFEITFDTKESLMLYIQQLDNLTNDDLLIVNIDSLKINNINNNYNTNNNYNNTTNNVEIFSGGGLQYLNPTIEYNGQTEFPLATDLTNFEILLFVNGQKLKKDLDYTVTPTQINYTNTDILLATTDNVEIYYG